MYTLDIRSLTCTKVEFLDLRVCTAANFKLLKAYSDNAATTFSAILKIYYNVFKFHVPRLITFKVMVQKRGRLCSRLSMLCVFGEAFLVVAVGFNMLWKA